MLIAAKHGRAVTVNANIHDGTGEQFICEFKRRQMPTGVATLLDFRLSEVLVRATDTHRKRPAAVAFTLCG